MPTTTQPKPLKCPKCKQTDEGFVVWCPEFVGYNHDGKHYEGTSSSLEPDGITGIPAEISCNKCEHSWWVRQSEIPL